MDTNLSAAQLIALKSAINAETNPAVVTARQQLDWAAMEAFYNTASNFIVWKPSLSVAEMQSVYVWSEILALTPAQFNALTLMQNQGFLTPAVANVRTGMAAILAGAANTLTALTALAKRAATNGERVFATGTGSNGSPGNLVATGLITERDLTLAFNS